jgi:hypothetical protein
METTFEKKAIRLTVLGIGIMFITSFTLLAHPGLTNAQQNKTLMHPQEAKLQITPSYFLQLSQEMFISCISVKS